MALNALRKRSWLLVLPQPAVLRTLSSFRVRNHSTDRAGQAPSGPLKGVKVVDASALFYNVSAPACSAAAAAMMQLAVTENIVAGCRSWTLARLLQVILHTIAEPSCSSCSLGA